MGYTLTKKRKDNDMEYRDQLKYIKSHQIEGGKSPRRNRRRRDEDARSKRKRSDKQPVKTGGFNRVLWLIQLVSSVFLMGAMLLLGILPWKYMAGLAVIILFLLLFVRILQKRKMKRQGRKGGGRVLSVLVSALLVVLGLYSLKVNAALDEIATGEESGAYEAEHMLSDRGAF